MLNLETLEARASNGEKKPLFNGKWCSILVKPYPHADDVFCVGVIFIQTRKNKPWVKLLENFEAFSCLYGPGAEDQFRWLLSLISAAILKDGSDASLAPHAKLTDWRSAQGADIDALVNRLFNQSVMMRKNAKALDDRVVDSTFGMSTPAIRKKFAGKLKRMMPENFNKYWHEQGFERKVKGESQQLDLPIWSGENLFQPEIFGTVISCCYREHEYRGFYLTGAFRDLSVMYDLNKANGKGGLFILKPRQASVDILRQIDRSIDQVSELLHQKKTIISVADTADALCESVINFVANAQN
jgi:hypothetical protein